jgi:hypothetical protein
MTAPILRAMPLVEMVVPKMQALHLRNVRSRCRVLEGSRPNCSAARDRLRSKNDDDHPIVLWPPDHSSKRICPGPIRTSLTASLFTGTHARSVRIARPRLRSSDSPSV